MWTALRSRSTEAAGTGPTSRVVIPSKVGRQGLPAAVSDGPRAWVVRPEPRMPARVQERSGADGRGPSAPEALLQFGPKPLDRHWRPGGLANRADRHRAGSDRGPFLPSRATAAPLTHMRPAHLPGQLIAEVRASNR